LEGTGDYGGKDFGAVYKFLTETQDKAKGKAH
jgi:hypothetical protein